MKILLKGSTISKKNSKIIVCVGRFPKLLPSKAYKEWHKDACDQIVEQEVQMIKGPIKKAKFTFYSKDLRKFDLDNKASSVLDLLVDTFVLEDDNYVIVPQILLVYGGLDRENPRCEVVLTY